MLDRLYNKKVLDENLEGYWYRRPSANWSAQRIAISKRECQLEAEKQILFIAIDENTWAKGSKNMGIYAGWKNTHETVSGFQHLIAGVVSQRPIKDLDENIPQFIVDNSYDVIGVLACLSFRQRSGKMIAITGTAGKSTAKNMLNSLLSIESSVVATKGNHNTRTGVPLTIACGIEDPDYLVVESAISGLWMGKKGILKDYAPDVGLITSIDGGQKMTPKETALFKSRIAVSMKPNSTLVLNRDMLEYETIYNQIKEKQLNIITYGNQDTNESYIMTTNEVKGATMVKASILGEELSFTVSLIGIGMVYNTVAVLTIIKLLGHDLNRMLPKLQKFQAGESVLQFEEVELKDGETCTLLDDSWNATGIAMIETIDVFTRQSKYFQGKKIAILGRIENLGKDARRQHKLLVQPIIDSSIDLVFVHGSEMKYVLEDLPEQLIGGYFNNSKDLAKHVANIVTANDFVLIKGSPRSSDFKHVKKHLIKSLKTDTQPEIRAVNYAHPHATGLGALTVRLSDDKIVGQIGQMNVTQNQGLGNVILLHHILTLLFDRKLKLSEMYMPTSVEVNENKAPRSLQLRLNEKISLRDLIYTSIVNCAPNALLLLANQVLEGNRKTMELLREYRMQLRLGVDAVYNITGRRITNKRQMTSLDDLIKVGKLLFEKQSSILSLLSINQYFYQDRLYDAKTNLFDYGCISHGLFFGHKNSMALTLSQVNGERYLTAVIGAPNAYKRDLLVRESLEDVLKGSSVIDRDQSYPSEINIGSDKELYTINFLGDTYFGEFYTRLRQRQNKGIDALTKFGRDYSFSGIQPFFSQGDYNIANFEAVLSDGDHNPLRERKRYTLHADKKETVPALKRQNIHAVTLANNHLMDYGTSSLKETLQAFHKEDIVTIGAGSNLENAERYLTLNAGNKRVTIFNGYWYRHPMYRDYDFYAFDDKSGVASLSGNLLDNISEERRIYPNSIIVVVAHWGVDFERVRLKQREYAKAFSEAGANLIIGHGAHLMQEIEYFNDTLIVYGIGNGVFNSNGEYNRRGVPPYSFLAQVNIGEKLGIRLYPIYTNNLQTFWCPRFVNEKEKDHIDLLLRSYNNQLDYNWGKDEKRYFIELPINLIN